MGPISGVVVFILVWWTVFLCALPWGFERQREQVLGSPVSAPEHPKLGKKALITTILSVLIWIVIYILIDMRVIDFREMAAHLPR